ncbi:C-methyltransferase C-terminal domain-containing protein [Marinitoga hydrogenitolerans DSM 16785]|uniref:C-methyltransferase C-terminal domain-containing protein n=1 Tax=Marinitoga hydrogenitolerans (strain DSM 16785 / JCM 12826 / AT1271) TaxID=1122195 RepID=A0A1M4ZKD5_MARH1|nr:MarR family winged helix-turn-helix transcriptional regulator [Marinitoga hydrogenitolerans]SHF18474.1 C-methyltransferase C-terminal domain-containing protein [Marinitoga hydrogenitolerans DSM 16785]
MFDFEDYTFFNPSPNFRELMILQIISQNKKVSQETIAKNVGIVPSMVNRYLKDFEDKDYIVKTGGNRRNMNYEITHNGKKRLQFLTVSFINEVSNIYSETKKSFSQVLNKIENIGYKNILLYGAGVVGSIVLKVLNSENINVIGFIDDSIAKQGDKIHGINIYAPEEVKNLNYDMIIIASFRHSEDILKNANDYKLSNIYIFNIDANGNVSLEKGE